MANVPITDKLTRKKKTTWSWADIARLATLLVLGFLNTVFIKPENIGTWRNYIGYGCLVVAAIYAVVLIIKRIKGRGSEDALG
jgi:hypothetical protein